MSSFDSSSGHEKTTLGVAKPFSGAQWRRLAGIWRAAATIKVAMGAVLALLLVLGGSGFTLTRAQSQEVDEQIRQLLEAAEKNDHARVVELAGPLLDAEPPWPEAAYHRGRAYFCLHRVKESLEDLDRYVELRPELESRQWERGIMMYYAGQFERGAKQFELYRTYHSNDVENSVWRFLCLVPSVGVEEARRTMLPIRHDPRVPMMEIYDLYRGKRTTLDVSLAQFAGRPTSQEKDVRQFYAGLYLGLYYLAVEGDEASARMLLERTARLHRSTPGINRFMWSVADVHARRLMPASESEVP